jgi:osmotically-inducible protein OsmY
MDSKKLFFIVGLGLAAISPASWAGVMTAANESSGYVDDAALTTKIKAALLAEKNLKSLDIGVESTNGVVTLSGTVPSSAQIDQAVDVAKHVKGVKDVHNDLHVKSTSAQ